MYTNFVAGAAKVSQLISFGCGFWLTFSSPFALVFSALSLKFQEAVLCAFLIPFGMLMVGMEVPLQAVQRVLQQYFFFVYTRPGRGAFVVHVAACAWMCSRVGMMTKMLMAFNALLTFYILNSRAARFAQVDADAAAALSQATDELKGSAAEALSFGKMFSSAFGGFGKGRSGTVPARAPAGGSGVAAGSFGGFDSTPFPASDSSVSPSWPSGDDGSSNP